MAHSLSHMGEKLLDGLERCPHCGTAFPTLSRVWHSEKPTYRADGQKKNLWAAYTCSTCGGVVTVKGRPGSDRNDTPAFRVYPSGWSVPDTVPATASKFLDQAAKTVGQPDASVVMSASCIDAMLKHCGLVEGSLYSRINDAVKQGILTKGMAEWAHRVRLDANNPRHADVDNPHMTFDDAERALIFAKALSEILFVLPSKMPQEEEEKDEK